LQSFELTSSGTVIFILCLALPLAALVLFALWRSYRDDAPLAPLAFGAVVVMAMCGTLIYFLYSKPSRVEVGGGGVVVRYPWPRWDRRFAIRELRRVLLETVGSEHRTPALTLIVGDDERVELGAAQEDGVIARLRLRLEDEAARATGSRP
jgi:hypothetical protein